MSDILTKAQKNLSRLPNGSSFCLSFPSVLPFLVNRWKRIAVAGPHPALPWSLLIWFVLARLVLTVAEAPLFLRSTSPSRDGWEPAGSRPALPLIPGG